MDAHLVNILGMNSKIYATAKEYVIKFMIFTIFFNDASICITNLKLIKRKIYRRISMEIVAKHHIKDIGVPPTAHSS
jgi:hypothetical protein